ncbi:class I glutamine amidotransferase-like protein [Ochromonadaceae sp. CCMP2298]|nr:class I glutamine amidotransferase-like protein [Ochromonadaceae sp. CCMP2298]|mmetsp:Transcript_32154/g.70846  ORF Transcript_32154/g.70846 Transcript_32154/m.70846 type:complete len:333 (+) Transcript_32154:149-1147(+)
MDEKRSGDEDRLEDKGGPQEDKGSPEEDKGGPEDDSEGPEEDTGPEDKGGPAGDKGEPAEDKSLGWKVPENAGPEEKSPEEDNNNIYEILFVCTSVETSSWGAPTGAWLKEIAEPYYVLQEAGYRADICSIAGGPPALDPQCTVDVLEDSPMARFLADSDAQFIFSHARSLAAIVRAGDLRNYCAIYLVGGHGCVDDFYQSADIKQAVESFLEESKGCIGAVCHGPLGLANCVFNGQPFLKNKFVAAFSNEEENILGLVDTLPVLTEDVMDEMGAVHVPSPPWKPHAVVDGRLVTGQNPDSSKEVAQRMLDVLRTKGSAYSAPQNVNKPWGS